MAWLVSPSNQADNLVMKALIEPLHRHPGWADIITRLIHSVVMTAVNVHALTHAAVLLHGDE